MVSSIQSLTSQSILGAQTSGSSRSSPTGGARSQLNINGEDAAQISLSQGGASSRASSAAKSPTAISFRESADTAQNAISQIANLRNRQVELAESASTRAIGDPALDQLNTELNNIQTEIERIESSATVNGQNVLSGVALGGTSSSNTTDTSSQAPQVNLVDARTLTRDPGDISSPSSAASTLTNLEELQTSSSQLLGRAESAANTVDEATQPEPAQVANEQADGGLSAKDAEQAVETVTNQIVTDLGAQTGSEEQTLLQILSESSQNS